MRCISIWNPFALLLVNGFKRIETRGWPAPKSLIGQRIGIASTKNIRPEQRSAFLDPAFREHYDRTGLPTNIKELSHGCLLGTVLLHSCDLITEDDLHDITEEERAFGWFEPGRYAWRCRDPEPLEAPKPVRGLQGIWELRNDLDSAQIIPFPKAENYET